MSEPAGSDLGRASQRTTPNCRVATCQLVIPDYRIGFFNEMHRGRDEFTLIAGDRAPNGVTSASRLPPWITRTNNRMLFGGRFVWQQRILKPLIGSDIAVVEMNPRSLSSWAVLLARRVLRRPSVAWGHAWSRNGREAARNRARLAMGALAQVTVVYTETEANALRQVVPERRVMVAPNAILPRSDICPAPLPGGSPPQSFCYVGRLIASKRPDVLLRAFLRAVEGLPEASMLHVVGDGPLRDELESILEGTGCEARVRFHGSVHGRDALRRIYSDCVASISAGESGLNIIQSLSFGVPLVVVDAADHGPEIEALDPGLNCIYFKRDDESDLTAALLRSMNQFGGDVATLRKQISARCAERYSFEIMASGMNNAIAYAFTPAANEVMR